MLFRDAKFIILGAADVGKTCLLQRYLTGQFAETVAVGLIVNINLVLNMLMFSEHWGFTGSEKVEQLQHCILGHCWRRAICKPFIFLL